MDKIGPKGNHFLGTFGMFDWKHYRPDLRRAPADEVVSYAIQFVVTAMLTALTGWYAYWSQLDPLIKIAAILFALGSVIWVLRQIRDLLRKPAKSPPTSASESEIKSEHPLDFWLSSNWDAGFRLYKPVVQSDPEIEGEEILLRVVAKQRLVNVRLEITIREQRDASWVSIGEITSDRFHGIVQKGMEQSFVLMRRMYFNVPAAAKIPPENRDYRTPIRIEKEVTFFPENPAAINGCIGGKYAFSIKVYHDDGPDQATFLIDLRRKVKFPETRIYQMTNIDIISEK